MPTIRWFSHERTEKLGNQVSDLEELKYEKSLNI